MKPYLLVAAPFLVLACSHPAREMDVGAPAPQAAPANVSFAGTWVYNPDDSDQPGRYGMGGGEGFGGGGRGGYGGRGGFGGRGRGGGSGGFGRGGAPPSGGDPDAADSLLRQPPGRLVIRQTDSSLTISPREQTLYTLFFDGRDVTLTDELGRTVTLNGRWRGRQFEVRRALRSGAELTERYEVKQNGERLVVRLRLRRDDSGTEMPEFQRVYDRYGP